MKMFVLKIIKRSGRPSPISENGPSDKWVRKFLKRHPELHMRKPQTIDGGRVRMANPNVMSQYFTLLKDTVDKLGKALIFYLKFKKLSRFIKYKVLIIILRLDPKFFNS